MESRKRIKLEAISAVNAANVFLTISDGNDTNSQEFLTIDCNGYAEVKQEQNVICGQTQALPIQYRMVNQPQQQQTTPAKAISLVNTQSNVFPAAMQLPSGCEIYLVNEYVETAENDGDNELVNNDMPYKRSHSDSMSVKSEGSNAQKGTTVSGGLEMFHQSSPLISTSVIKAYSPNENLIGNGQQEQMKRSVILDAYKKRDDKRRATHNEVERRRRDKINSWIFKLKELLPTDGPNSTNSNNNNNNTDNINCDNLDIATSGMNSNTSIDGNLHQTQQRNSCNQNRSPPIESKSQILIKACEYIKSMQDEVNSLRKCLKENECLRLNNRRLQQELNKLRCERKINAFDNDGNMVRLLTASGTNGNFGTTISSLGSGKLRTSESTTFSPYIKRELIITDYVD